MKPPVLNSGYKDMPVKFVEWSKKGYVCLDVLLSNQPKQLEVIAQDKATACSTC